MELDKLNGNTKWLDAIKLELIQLDEYHTFLVKPKGFIPDGHKKIRCHLVFDVKHDGRYKARFVAGGHLTEVPVESVYSGVVTLRGLRICIFLGEHNGQEIWCTDIGNAYLESFTTERVYFIAGPEFGELEGCTMIIVKALYGLRTLKVLGTHSGVLH